MGFARSRHLLRARAASLIAARLNRDATATAFASNCPGTVFARLDGTETRLVQHTAAIPSDVQQKMLKVVHRGVVRRTNAIAKIISLVLNVRKRHVTKKTNVSMELAAWIQRPRLVATATTGGDAIHTEEHVPLNTFRAVTDAQLGAAGAER